MFVCSMYIRLFLLHLDDISGDKSDLLQAAISLVTRVLNGETSLEEVHSTDLIAQLKSALDEWKASMAPYRTAQLWIMYKDLVAILCAFIRSSRTGNWVLYIQTLHAMLPYMAAAGHNNYTKSLMLFLQKMEKLPQTHPYVYSRFCDGLFVIRRTDKYWSGIFTDLCIEQVLMGSIKSVGGLSRGRGFDESTSLVWLLSMPCSGEVFKAMEGVTGLTKINNEEVHKDLTNSRLQRDAKDTQSVMDFLVERKPFAKEPQLQSLSSGIIGDESVNVDAARPAGTCILESMEGISVQDFKFSRKKQVTTLAACLYVTVDEEKVEIDPKVLYQRLLVAGNGTVEPDILFQYELCSYPTSLFDTNLRMRNADKATLQQALFKEAPKSIIKVEPVGMTFVIDGGALLQRLPWPKCSTYGAICLLYSKYIDRHFSAGEVVIVFDGYSSGPTTKDEAHHRRAASGMGVDVDVGADMVLRMQKKLFLANQKNKQKFITLLGSILDANGIQVKHAEADADYDIAIAACSAAQLTPVTVIAEDTDVLVLLIHHMEEGFNQVVMKTNSRMIDIGVMKAELKSVVCKTILFLHALTGCDTTSKPYGVGKASGLAKVESLEMVASVFYEEDQLQSNIDAAGGIALAILYGCADLDSGREYKFKEKVLSTSNYVPPERLPPTSDAARFHSRRVYHQVQEWRGNSLDPKEWGWLRNESTRQLRPQRMEQAAAPACLLKVIRCKCTGRCDRNTCTCRKNVLKCTSACGICKGITCANGEVVESSDIE